MKLFSRTLAALLALSFAAAADPVTTAFTWQGRLDHDGAPANGSFDLKFELFDAAANGNLIGAPIELPAQAIGNGLFSTELDFGGPPVFDGTAYWLAVSARVAGEADYVTVPGRTAIHATPYAMHALSAAAVKDGAITDSSLADGAVTGVKLSTGAVGTTQLNALVPPNPGQVLSFDGTDLLWITPAGDGGVSGPWKLNDTTAYYNLGFVGIGSNEPSLYPLTITTETSQYGLNHTDGITSLATYAGASGGWLGTVSNHPLKFFTYSGGAAMTIGTDGNVGIGNANPVAPLHVAANWTAGEIPNIRLSGQRPTLMWVRDRGFPDGGFTDYWLNHMSGTVQGNLTFYHRGFNGSIVPFSDTGYRPVMSVTPALTVGIGTENPEGKLHLYDADSVTQVLESGGGTNAWSQLRFKNGNGQWIVGTSRNYNGDQLYFSRLGGAGIPFGIQPNGDAYAAGDVTATRLVLRADPVAPTNAAVLCGDAGVTNFVPYNTATNKALNLVVSDATVKTLTITGGADLAEPFAMSHHGIEPGTVVVIDEKNPGKLKCSTRAYDKKVAGIVSGANGVQPGISMIQEDKLEAGENVALSGRVYVKADTGAGAIEPGDLLTTSSTAGSAMKAADHHKSQGAILGKAMTGLDEGSGMVLVLVTLQ